MKRNHSNQLLEKWVEAANEKKGEVEKEITSASQAQTLFRKGPQEGLPALTLPHQMGNGLRCLGQIPICGFSQAKLVWLYKQDLEAFLCYKRAGNKYTRVSSWRFFVVLVCFPGGQAVFPSLRTAPACSLRGWTPLWEDQASSGKFRALEKQGKQVAWLFPGVTPWLVREGQEPGVHLASGPPCWASQPGFPTQKFPSLQ